MVAAQELSNILKQGYLEKKRRGKITEILYLRLLVQNCF